MKWQPIDTAPVGKEMFVAIAVGIHNVASGPYTTDPYCVWQPSSGIFRRWPHRNFNPTHWMPLPEPPEER